MTFSILSPIQWLLEGDISIQYQAHLTLLDSPKSMEEALGLIIHKKRKNNRWPVQQKYSGKVYFDMEQTGGDSRWNTLRVLRVLRFYKPELYRELTN